MHIVAALASIGLILIVLWDAFEVVILPRRVMRKFRLARLFYRSTWRPWALLARRKPAARPRAALFSFCGSGSVVFPPLSFARGASRRLAVLPPALGPAFHLLAP